MVVRMNNPRENDYDIFCDDCGSEEICDHEYGRGKDLESIDFCISCCEKCKDKCSSCGKSKNRSSTFGAICNKCGKGQV